MPPARTSTDTSTFKRKPGKPLTACAECRRSKLRCDGQVPCNTCISRGCKSICPNQTLTLRKKYTYVLSGTDELHQSIETLVERIIALEGGLAKLESSHALLAPNLLKIKESVVQHKPLDLDSSTHLNAENEAEGIVHSETRSVIKQEHQLEDILGTLSLSSSGEATYFGSSSGTDGLRPIREAEEETTLPYTLLELCNTEYVRPDEPALLAEIMTRIPPLSQTVRFCNNYFRHCRYKFTFLFTRDDLFSQIVEPVYSALGSQNPNTTILAIMFCIIAIGAKYSYSLPINPVESRDYFRLAIALTKLRPPSKQATLDNMRLLIYMTYFRHISPNEGNNTAWMTMNEAVGMGISAGLHVNSEHWNLPPSLVEKRHRTFWSLFVTETMLGLSAGRPPAISLKYVDTPIPKSLDAGQKWIIQYSKLLHTISSTVLSATTPSYKTILSLDKQMRELVLTDEVISSQPKGNEDPEVCFLQHMITMHRESALVVLHKPYFAVALRDPERLQSHKYMPSVTSICRSASRMIKGQRAYWSYLPTRPIVERMDVPWFYTLTAMVAMFQIATKAPQSELALMASQCLRIAEALMQDAALTCPFAAKHLDMARQMNAKASSDVLESSGTGTVPVNQALLEEIEQIAGKTHLSFVPAPLYEKPENIVPWSESYDTNSNVLSYDWVEPTQASLNGGDMAGFDMRRFDSVFQSVQADAPVDAQYMHPDLVLDFGQFSRATMTDDQFSADPQIWGACPWASSTLSSSSLSSSSALPLQNWSDVAPFDGTWERGYQVLDRPWTMTV